MLCKLGKSISLALLVLSTAGTWASGQDRCCVPPEKSLLTVVLPDGGPVDNNAGEQEGASSIRVKSNGKTAQLMLSSLKGKPDVQLVRELAGVELTERMDTQQLEVWKAAMPGERSLRALIALADAASFLSLPSRETPPDVPLPKDAQAKLLEQMKTYVDETMARLPNFFATQDVSTFQAIEGMRNGANVVEHQPMHYAGEVTANVLYRGGKEVVENGKGELKESDRVGYQMLFSGQFGPVLNTVVTDAEENKLAWSHWETSRDSKLAVFKYSVTRKKSHCNVKVLMGDRWTLQAHPGYHGEIALDPATGAILRLTLIADLSQDDPMSAANLMLEYGPVELGGKSYLCLIRSVTVETIKQADPNGGATVHTQQEYGTPPHDGGMTYDTKGDVPQEILMNDVAFSHYQLLRSESKVIPDEEQLSAPKH